MELICPYCYHSITSPLHFVCTGNPAPGGVRCDREINANRARETLIQVEMYPVFAPPVSRGRNPLRGRAPLRGANCPGCRNRSGEPACPCCNTPLPSNFGAEPSPVVAMAGATSTGKTVYLTVLAHHLRTVLRDRFRADVGLLGDSANTWVRDEVDALFRKRLLPAFTAQPEGRSEPLVFEWRQPVEGRKDEYRSSYLSFMDTAGESLGTEKGIDDLSFLGKVHAFIVLLDPFTLPRFTHADPDLGTDELPAYRILQQVTRVLRNAHGVPAERRVDVPLAVVFAKIDALEGDPDVDPSMFWPEPTGPGYHEGNGLAAHQSVRELIIRYGGGAVDRFLEVNYSAFRYFVVSALGRPPENRRVAELGVRPLHVSEPLLWLLNTFKVVRRTDG
jgi:hypothetical protein